GSIVSFGSLVILPVEGSILYVQPMFVTAENLGIPELKKVALVLGDEVVFEDTFDEALAQLFDVEAPDEDDPVDPTDEDEPEPEDPGDPRDESPELAAIVAEAGRVYEEAQDALAAGDFEEYGRLIEELGRLLEQADLLTEDAATDAE
ncbi:MAG TPA: hypothetical protein VEU29_05815, partial [Actinomycetota bacterium]|nr:hypothetical protein [Actinomycetota bacterium]